LNSLHRRSPWPSRRWATARDGRHAAEPAAAAKSSNRRRQTLTTPGIALLFLAGFAQLSHLEGQEVNYVIRFNGNGVSDIDRIKIRIDDPNNTNDEPGPPVDVGASDFTIEFWLKAQQTDNAARSIACGGGVFSWIAGNIVLDRDRYSSGGRDFGISLANGGRVAFGVENATGQAYTLCGAINVLDDAWHHIAVQRRLNDGWLWIFVDGQLDVQADGPGGDISYPGNVFPDGNCGGPCTNSDPFIVLGAEKHDVNRVTYPPYTGLLDELRFSTTLRYASGFVRPTAAFVPDGITVGLYHFDEGFGAIVLDSAVIAGAPTNGEVKYGGSPPGPSWVINTPFTQSAPSRPRNVRVVR